MRRFLKITALFIVTTMIALFAYWYFGTYSPQHAVNKHDGYLYVEEGKEVVFLSIQNQKDGLTGTMHIHRKEEGVVEKRTVQLTGQWDKKEMKLKENKEGENVVYTGSTSKNQVRIAYDGKMYVLSASTKDAFDKQVARLGEAKQENERGVNESAAEIVEEPVHGAEEPYAYLLDNGTEEFLLLFIEESAGSGETAITVKSFLLEPDKTEINSDTVMLFGQKNGDTITNNDGAGAFNVSYLENGHVVLTLGEGINESTDEFRPINEVEFNERYKALTDHAQNR